MVEVHEILGLFVLGVVILFTVETSIIANALIDGERKAEQACHDYLAKHGYEFVAYHPQSFGSPEECWGSINGTSVRVY